MLRHHTKGRLTIISFEMWNFYASIANISGFLQLQFKGKSIFLVTGVFIFRGWWNINVPKEILATCIILGHNIFMMQLRRDVDYLVWLELQSKYLSFLYDIIMITNCHYKTKMITDIRMWCNSFSKRSGFPCTAHTLWLTSRMSSASSNILLKK